MTTRLIAAVVLVAGVWFGANTYTQRQQAAAAAQKAAAERAAYETDARKAIAAIRGAVVAIDAYSMPKELRDRVGLTLPELVKSSEIVRPFRSPSAPFSAGYIAQAWEHAREMWHARIINDTSGLRLIRLKVENNLGIAEEAIKVGK